MQKVVGMELGWGIFQAEGVVYVKVRRVMLFFFKECNATSCNFPINLIMNFVFMELKKKAWPISCICVFKST